MTRNRNNSGKIAKPGPDSPGGPRVHRLCLWCNDDFWPRVVDVEAGHGKYCSNPCSGKATRRCVGCGGKRGVGGNGSRCAKCLARKQTAKQRLAEEREAASRAKAEQKAAAIDPTKLSLRELGSRINRSYRTMATMRSAGLLGGAWDGQRFDTNHPDAAAFLSRKLRKKNGARVVCQCPHCGKKTERAASQAARVYCDETCESAARTTLAPKHCEHCNTLFKPKESTRRFCKPECGRAAAKYSEKVPRYLVFGEEFTMKQLEAASGLSGRGILDRVKAGEPIESAITRPTKPGPRLGRLPFSYEKHVSKAPKAPE